ncbi:MAG: type II toxin-antitoxin system RelE/ParE family toxin [Mesorhizobium sp.]
MKRVTYSREALKTLRRIPANEATRILAKINQYARDPASLAQNVVKLQGRDGYRLRIGNWRVIFDEDGTVIDVIDVIDVGARGGIYD